MGSQTDEELMLAYQAGERQAFEELFGRYQRRIYNYFRRHRAEPTIVEDLFQTTFLRVHEARERYRPDSAFSTWLYTIATNLLRDEARRVAARPSPGATAPGECAAPPRSRPEREVERRQLRDRLAAAVRELPEEQREAFVLGKYEGRSYEEIAGIVGCSVGAVKVRVHRAMKSLRTALEETAREV